MLSAGGNHHRSADCKQCWTEEFACKHGCCPAGFITNFFNMQMVLRRKSRHRQTTMEHEFPASKSSNNLSRLNHLHVRSGSQRKGARRRCGHCWRVPRRALVGYATECRHNMDSARFEKLLGILFQIVSSFWAHARSFQSFPSDRAGSMI